MDTQNAAPVQIPDLKLAKVGGKRERKRGGLGWLSGGRGAGSAFSGAAGGSGAAVAGGLGLGKMLVCVMLAAVFSAGAWQVGKMMAAASEASEAAPKKVFADNGPQHYADTSDVIKADNSIPNSMGYVSGSMDTRTPEEIAKAKADAEAARKAEEDEKKKAEEEANKQPDAPASSPTDPATIGATNAKLHQGKFGSLGSTTGGLSGGSGLSGGINRNFGGVSGLGSKIAKGQGSSMTAFRSPSKPSMSKAGGAVMNKGRTKGFAKSQLMNAFTQSKQAMAAGKTETAAATSASAFDNNAGQGSVIDGPAAAAPKGTPDSQTPSNQSGPMNSSDSSPCGSGQYADSNGTCQNTNNNGSKNATPYQGLLDTAMALMLTVTLLTAIAWALEDTVYGTTIGKAIRVIVGILGAVIMGIGIAIAAMKGGDMMIGGIIGAVGAFIAATAMFSTVTNASSFGHLAAEQLIAAAIGDLAAASKMGGGGGMQ